jgi:hypothetical protein
MRGWEPDAKVFWTFMAGILDRDNLTLLVKLNLSPIEITGLTEAVKPDTALVDLAKWVPGYNLTRSDLIELFTYVTASEQLKRLDAILRASIRMNDSLSILAAANANPKAIPQYVRDSWLNSTLTPSEKAHLESIIANSGTITPFHPIVSASRSEANRISELLHSLNALDTTMVANARNGLLDMFRTSLSSIWFSEDNTFTQEVRSLFTRTLTTLASVFTSEKRVVKGVRDLSLSYSVVLTTIGRLWSVTFIFGGKTRVNALRANVTRNVLSATSTLSEVLGNLNIVSSNSDSTISQTKVAAPKNGKRRRH